MTPTETELHKHIEEAAEDVRQVDRGWAEDLITIDSVPSALSSAARAYNYLATTAAMLGATEQARQWFGEEARWYAESRKGYRLRRDMRELGDWKNEPPILSRAVDAAVLSRDQEIVQSVARCTLEMDEVYLEVFSDDAPVSAAKFYNSKAKAALAIDDERARGLVNRLETEVQHFDDPNRYWQAMPQLYRGLLEGSEAAVQSAVTELYEYHADRDFDADDPRQYVLQHVCAYVVLARRHGIDVSIESDRLPDAILHEDIPADDVELDVDLSGLRLTSRVGFFELEQADDGQPVIRGRIYHPGGGDVTADDVPEREAGRVLSDAWIEAALDEAEWREHYDDDLVSEARAAFEDGTLRRTLVVVQDRTDEYLFDESLAELPIDDVQLLKGAGRPE